MGLCPSGALAVRQEASPTSSSRQYKGITQGPLRLRLHVLPTQLARPPGRASGTHCTQMLRALVPNTRATHVRGLALSCVSVRSLLLAGGDLTMKQSPLLTFESSAFPPMAGEDRETNAGIFGKALALWIAEQLRTARFMTGDVIAEDFGWCVPVESKPNSLYVACASTDENADRWSVFAFAEAGMLTRLLGNDRRVESVAALFTAVQRCLASAPGIRELREEPFRDAEDRER